MKFNPKLLSEYNECALFCDWLQYAYPWVSEMTHHSPNELCKQKHDAINMKRIGMKPGFPDYQILIPSGEYHGLFIEMKKSDKQNHKKNDNQEEWIKKLNHYGYFATYAFGFDEASEILINYLKKGKL